MGAGILMTWQKLGGFVVLGVFNEFVWILVIICLISSIVGSIGGFGEIVLKKMMGYSSVSHGGWMVGLLLCDSFIFYFYFLIYSFLLVAVLVFFFKFDFIIIGDFYLRGGFIGY